MQALAFLRSEMICNQYETSEMCVYHRTFDRGMLWWAPFASLNVGCEWCLRVETTPDNITVTTPVCQLFDRNIIHPNCTEHKNRRFDLEKSPFFVPYTHPWSAFALHFLFCGFVDLMLTVGLAVVVLTPLCYLASILTSHPGHAAGCAAIVGVVWMGGESPAVLSSKLYVLYRSSFVSGLMHFVSMGTPFPLPFWSRVQSS